MHIYIYIHITETPCQYLSIYIYIYIHIYVYCIYMNLCSNLHVQGVSVRAHNAAYIHTYIIQTSICTFINTHIHIHMYICILCICIYSLKYLGKAFPFVFESPPVLIHHLLFLVSLLFLRELTSTHTQRRNRKKVYWMSTRSFK